MVDTNLAAPAESWSNSPVWQELRAAYASQNLVVCAGPGLPAAAGLPSWSNLVQILADRARTRGASTDVLDEIDELVEERKYLEALAAAKHYLGPAEFGTVVERNLDDRLADDIPDMAKAIAELQPKLRAVLTTNIDHLLERAFVGRWHMFARATADLAQRRHYILKLHGTLLERDTWVLTRDDYNRAMYADPRFTEVFTALFHTVPILFVGYGINDDDFDQVLMRVCALSGEQPPGHFALVPADEIKPHRRWRLEQAGIRILTYPNADGTHNEICAILGALDSDSDPDPDGLNQGAANVEPPRTFTDIVSLLRFFGDLTVSIDRTDAQPGLESDPLAEIDVIARYLDLQQFHSCRAQILVPGQLARRAVSAHLGLGPSGQFVVVLKSTTSGWQTYAITIAQCVGRCGGKLEIISDDPLEQPVDIPGMVWTSLPVFLNDALRALLSAHAYACMAQWTDVDELQYVAARACWSDSYLGESECSVQEAIDHCLQTAGRVVLLGDFGTGKTTQLRRRAALMARDYLDREGMAAPLYLPLTGLQPRFADAVLRHLGEHVAPQTCQQRSIDLLRFAVDLGVAIPFFDGIDECQLDKTTPEDAIVNLLAEFQWRLARQVISSRKTVFQGPQQLNGLQTKTALAVINLLGFDRSEVIAFVEKTSSSPEQVRKTIDQIDRIHDLGGLAQRPALLDLIVRNRDQLSHASMSPAELYQIAAEDWLGTRPEDQLDHGRRLAFARSLARRLFTTDKAHATRTEILREVVSVLDDDWESVDAAVREARIAVFLAFDEETDCYRFAHRSFLEYFLAVDIAKRMAAGRRDALDLPRITPEIAAFLTELTEQSHREHTLQSILAHRYRPRVSENALLALYYAARHEQHDEGPALGERLAALIGEQVQLEGAQLGGIDLAWIALRHANLRRANLTGASLRMADMRAAVLDQAHAAHAILDGAVLDRAQLRDADLFRTSLVDASTRDVDWSGTDRDGMVQLEPSGAGDRAPDSDAAVLAPVHQALRDVIDVAWSPDGRWLAVADGLTIRICDHVTGENRITLAGQADTLLCIAFSPDGSRVAAGSADGIVQLWNPNASVPLQILRGHRYRVRSVAFAPDGSVLASGGRDGTVRLWHPQTGALLRTLKRRRTSIRSVAFAPDGSVLAAGTSSGRVQLWNPGTGMLLRVLDGARARVRSVVFSPDGSVLAFSADDGTVRLANPHTGAVLQTIAGHHKISRCVAFAPDGSMLAAGTDDGTVPLWDPQTGGLHRTLTGQQATVRCVAFAPDGSMLAFGAEDGTVWLWNLRKSTRLRRFESQRNSIWSVAFAPDGGLLASGSEDGTVRLWNPRTGNLCQTLDRQFGSGSSDGMQQPWPSSTATLLPTLDGPLTRVWCVAFAPDGSLLASGYDDGTVRVAKPQASDRQQTINIKGHQNSVLSVAFAPDGKLLASGSAGGTVRLWDPRTGVLQQTLKGHQFSVRSVAFAPDGKLLASGSFGGTVRLWEPKMGAALYILTGHQHSVGSVAFSPAGDLLVSGSTSGTIRLWDPRTGMMLRTLKGQRTAIFSLAFSPDGTLLASACEDGKVRLWDLRTGILLRTLKGHHHTVRSVAFSPDGTLLASGSFDGTMRFWHPHEGRCLATIIPTCDGWLTLAADTPFYSGSGDIGSVLRFACGSRIMQPALWAPLLSRPDLVACALAGESVDLAALAMDSYAACARSLQRERERRGLIQRRRVLHSACESAPSVLLDAGKPKPNPAAAELGHTLWPNRTKLVLRPRRGHTRPPINIAIRARDLPAGAEVTATTQREGARPRAATVTRQRFANPAQLHIAVAAAEPGPAILNITVTDPEGRSRTDAFVISFSAPNPYIAGPPIHAPRDFYGRDHILDRLVRDLDTHSVAVLGPVRVGKTSLLHQVAHGFSGNCKLVSLQSYMGRFQAFLPDLARLIAPGENLPTDGYTAAEQALAWRLDELNKRGRSAGDRTGSGSAGSPSGSSSGSPSDSGKLTPFILMLDEAQLLASEPVLGHQLHGLFQSLCPRGLRVLAAGPPDAMRKLAYNGDSSLFLNMFHIERLSFMTRAEINRLIREPVGDEVVITNEAVDRVFALSGGQPLIAQILGREALEWVRERRGQRMEEADIQHIFAERVFDALIDTFGYADRWRGWPDQIKAILESLVPAFVASVDSPESAEQTTATALQALDLASWRLLDEHGLVDRRRRVLEVEPAFFLWLTEETA